MRWIFVTTELESAAATQIGRRAGAHRMRIGPPLQYKSNETCGSAFEDRLGG